jgi:hypothetical protein
MSDDFMSGEGWAIIGPVAEYIANEELEIEKARRDTLGEDYLEPEDPATDFDFDPEDD